MLNDHLDEVDRYYYTLELRKKFPDSTHEVQVYAGGHIVHGLRPDIEDPELYKEMIRRKFPKLY